MDKEAQKKLVEYFAEREISRGMAFSYIELADKVLEIMEELGYRKPSPELRFKANDLLVNCSTHFDNAQIDAALDVFDEVLALIVPKDKAVLSEEEIKELGLVTYDERGDIDDVDIGGIAQAQRDK